MSDNILYLVQLRASAIEQAEKDGYTWMAPSHVLNLLDTIEEQRARVAKLEAALKDARIQFEMWHEAKNIIARIDAALKDAPQ